MGDNMVMKNSEAVNQMEAVKKMTTIKNSKDLKIANVSSLPFGTGAKFLECIKSHEGTLIAKAWHRKLPVNYEVVVIFN